MTIKTTLRFHDTPIRITKVVLLLFLMATNAGMDGRKEEDLFSAGDSAIRCNQYRDQCGGSSEI